MEVVIERASCDACGGSIQAIGAVGCILRSAGLANALWAPEASGSWEFVYSVQDFRESQDIGYDRPPDSDGIQPWILVLRP